MAAMCETNGNDLDLYDFDFFYDVLDPIVPISGPGFYIATEQGMCIRVDCHDTQNGSYGSDLTLVYDDEYGVTLDTMDITDICKEDIY